jgi:hypothetical protein
MGLASQILLQATEEEEKAQDCFSTAASLTPTPFSQENNSGPFS